MKKHTILILIFSLFFIQCSKKTMLRKYYVLEIALPQMEASLDSLSALPYRFEVKDMTVAKAYNQTRIALRSASHELNYYYYHNWAVRPPVAISDLVYQIMKNSGVCPNTSRGHMANPDYIVTGYIDQLERNELGDRPVAHISGYFELNQATTDKRVVNYQFNRDMDLVNTHSMNTFADVISTILFEETQGFIRKIHQELTKQDVGS